MTVGLKELLNRQYTLGEIMNIDQQRQYKASGCRVSLDKIYHEIKKESLLDKFKSFFLGKNQITMYYLIFKLKVVGETGNQYTVFIRLNPDFDLTKWTMNPVKIYCSCNDFMYRSAYVLNTRNSLFLTDRTSLKLGPAVTNAPKAGSRTTLLCKHAFAAVNWLVSNYQSIMRTI